MMKRRVCLEKIMVRVWEPRGVDNEASKERFDWRDAMMDELQQKGVDIRRVSKCAPMFSAVCRRGAVKALSEGVPQAVFTSKPRLHAPKRVNRLSLPMEISRGN